jgi:hypothetical protein
MMRDPVWNGPEHSTCTAHPLIPNDDHLRADFFRDRDKRVGGLTSAYSRVYRYPGFPEAINGPRGDAFGVRQHPFVCGDRIDYYAATCGQRSARGNEVVARHHVQRHSESGCKFAGFVDCPACGV